MTQPVADDSASVVGELSVLVSSLHREAALGGVEAPDVLASMATKAAPWLGQEGVDAVVASTRRRLVGLGEIEPLLVASDISDILINGPGRVRVERAGHLEFSSIVLDSDGVRLLVDRIALLARRRPDARAPVLECVLPAGHRVTVAVAPVATGGPLIAIRRFRTDLHGIGSFDESRRGLIERLVDAVAVGESVLIAGPTGAGKTTLIGALIDLVPTDDRVVLIEDTAEVNTTHPDVARLVTRAESPTDLPIDLESLVRLALRLRPDRIVVGEVRGREARGLVQALNTGHRGGLASIHAASTAGALRRLWSLCDHGAAPRGGDPETEQLLEAFDLVAVVAPGQDGRRQLVDVAPSRSLEAFVCS
ncbi:MAG: CpaF family protein [Actinomycetia bacterium]|nr:CpaF family protein [Actinomycetes bacterium]MCP4961570.1 CpaF family protein [Actinomycetes bacterium]